MKHGIFLGQERAIERSVILLAILALVALLVWRMSDALLVIFAAILVAIFLDGIGRMIARFTRMGRTASLTVGVLAMLAMALAVIAVAGPQMGQQLTELGRKLPEAIDWAKDLLRQFSWGRALLIKPPDSADLVSGTGTVLGQIGGLFSATFGALVKVPIILIAGIYLAISPGLYVHGLKLLIPPKHRGRGSEVLGALGQALRWWLIGQLASMTIVGVLTGLGLWLIGMPMALALGLVTGLLSFIPMLGPILAAIPALLIALMQDPLLAVYVAVVYSVAQALEGNLITPLIQRHTVTLLPAVLVCAQLLMGILLGFAGVVLATPLLVVTMVLAQMLYIQDFLGSEVRVLGTR